jgi:hypothetical protein
MILQQKFKLGLCLHSIKEHSLDDYALTSLEHVLETIKSEPQLPFQVEYLHQEKRQPNETPHWEKWQTRKIDVCIKLNSILDGILDLIIDGLSPKNQQLLRYIKQQVESIVLELGNDNINFALVGRDLERLRCQLENIFKFYKAMKNKSRSEISAEDFQILSFLENSIGLNFDFNDFSRHIENLDSAFGVLDNEISRLGNGYYLVLKTKFQQTAPATSQK